MGKERIVTYDIAKGIGIILVVLGHICSTWHMNRFIYQFHMPLFFFLSGIFYKQAEKFLPFCLKKIKRLYVPFIAANTIFLLLYALEQAVLGNGVTISGHIKHFIKILLTLDITPLGGATWFLTTLLKATLLMKIIDVAIGYLNLNNRQRAALHTIIIAVLALIGLTIHLPFRFERELFALLFLYLGHVSFKTRVTDKLFSLSTCKLSVITIISMISLELCSYVNIFDIGWGNMGNPFMTILSSLIGIVFTLCLSKLIEKAIIFNNALQKIGTSTMWILIGHFVVFKLINIVQVIVYRQPIDNISHHPTYMTQGGWPFLYLILGILLPVLIKDLTERIRNRRKDPVA